MTMTHKSLKLLIVVATFFVWVRLFVGTVQTLNSTSEDHWNNRAFATEKTK
ncbi:hypothetical protein [Cyanobacterium sp. uoEpiScrs1]|uniref:hypothetical protein n=1 Tax=Cyanobacterium sp. uoEpiScrs1 TaxID=2976343 RepID=UPI00226AB222|nr:hypothetical protein [Cyanobacterium sp. uoEpiScrs1]